MLARHLAFSALKAGYSVLFVRADKMFDALKLSILDGSHDRTLRYYLKYELLVIDDFAIRSLSRDEADDLYELIIERHEQKSSISHQLELLKNGRLFFRTRYWAILL